MERQRIYRHCPEHHNSPCYNSTCEHQCFFEEKECREPEHHHHKECPVTGATCHNPECHGNKCAFNNYPFEKQNFSRKIYRCYEQQTNIVEHFLKIIDRLTEEEHHHRKHPQKTRLVLSGLKYKHLTIKNSIIMALSLNVKEFVTSTLGLVDHATQSPITDASFSNQSYVSQAPEIVTVDGAGIVTGIAFGSTTIIVTTDVAYTGSDGQPKTETGKSLLVAVQVNAVPQTTDLTITFSAPQPVPTV